MLYPYCFLSKFLEINLLLMFEDKVVTTICTKNKKHKSIPNIKNFQKIEDNFAIECYSIQKFFLKSKEDQ